MDQISVAIAQLVSTESISENCQQILDLCQSLDSKVDLVCLPENSLYNKIENSSSGLSLTDPCIDLLQQWVDKNNTIMNLGALPLKKNNKIYNSTVILQPNSSAQNVYDKIHLFDVKIGDMIISESAQFSAGEQTSLMSLLGWKMAFSICYDVRFSEIFLKYHKQEADIVFIPSAFTRHTGRAHWQTLIKARAIENQCYIIAPAQTGKASHATHERLSYGNSMVVDPWGKVLVHIEGENPEIATIQIDKKLISKTRQAMPIAKHRRL